MIVDLQEYFECETSLVFCHEHWERWERCPNFTFEFWWRSYVIFTVLSIYVLPLLIISICYTLILRHLWKHDSLSHQHAFSLRTKVEYHKRVTVTRMVLAVIFAFAICWLPLHVMNIWSRFDPSFYQYHDNSIMTAFKGVSHGLVYVNSGINPILYAILGSNFRNHFRQILAGKLIRTKHHSSSCLQPNAKLIETKTTDV